MKHLLVKVTFISTHTHNNGLAGGIALQKHICYSNYIVTLVISETHPDEGSV